jgi:hypothetical protein
MKGELKTDSQMTTIIPVTMDHNHNNNERRTEMQQLRVSVKRKAGDDLTSRPSKLIRSELHKLDGHLLHSEDIRSVAQSLYRARRKIHSGLPKSREDVHNAIELMDTRTSENEEFVITNDVPSGLIIFSCSSNLEFLTNSAEEILLMELLDFVLNLFTNCTPFMDFVMDALFHWCLLYCLGNLTECTKICGIL